MNDPIKCGHDYLICGPVIKGVQQCYGCGHFLVVDVNQDLKILSVHKENPNMSNSEQQIEQEIQDKGLNAPRLTPDHIDAQITGEQYFVFPGTTVTICLLTLVNGFTVTGESACASPENFNEEIGRKIARDQARDKIWLLEGYLLKEKLHSGKEFNAASGDNLVSYQVHSLGVALAPYQPSEYEKINSKIYLYKELLSAEVSDDFKSEIENKLRNAVVAIEAL